MLSGVNCSAAQLKAGVVLVLLGAACGPRASAPSGSIAPTKVQVGVKIAGPSTIAPGQAAQLSALETFNDGSSQDVTATARWHSSDTSILTIDATGVASGIQSGDAYISATLSSGLGAAQSILVVPSGTFRLSGNVTGLGLSLSGALVQVVAGTGAGLSSSTVGGQYRLYGVAGNVQVSVSDASYVTLTEAVTVNNNTFLNFVLTTVNPPPNLAGTYALRITADSACATTGGGALPAAGRERVYTATIQEEGPQVRTRLSGATFLPNSNNSFDGNLTADGASFCCVNWPDYYYSGVRDVAEVLPGDEVYLPSGAINVTLSDRRLTGTLNGTITVRGNHSVDGPVIGQCTSAHHIVTFTSQSGNPTGARTHQ